MKKFYLLLFLLILFLCLPAGPKPPSLNKAKENFYLNSEDFESLSNFACSLGKQKQEFALGKDFYSYGDKVDPKHRIKELDRLLAKIDSYAVNYRRTEDGKCELTIDYFVSGFAGTGVKFLYFFQKQNPIYSEDSKLHDDEIKSMKRRVEFDYLLAPNWYLYYRKTT